MLRIHWALLPTVNRALKPNHGSDAVLAVCKVLLLVHGSGERWGDRRHHHETKQVGKPNLKPKPHTPYPKPQTSNPTPHTPNPIIVA